MSRRIHAFSLALLLTGLLALPAKAAVSKGKDIAAGGTASGAESVFPDVADHWSKAYVARAVELGLFGGYEDGVFRPDAAMSRAQLVTVLYRMSGSPDVAGKTPFTDISAENAEFRRGIAWAYESGFIDGRTETVFDPSGGVTRQEAVKILFGLSGGASGPEALLTPIYDSGFADSAEIAPWAKSAMYWAYYREIIGGETAATLAPRRVATRAEIAKILVNYIEEFGI